jgi:hypothetical protein
VAEFAPVFSENGNVLPKGTRIPMQERFRKVANEYGLSSTNALLDALIGVAPGATATRPRTQIKHNSGSANDQGGKVQTEVYAPINRATTAADVTALKALFTGVRKAPTAYPRDLSGNGGPAYTPG